MKKRMLVTMGVAWCLAGAAVFADGGLRTYQTANVAVFGNAGMPLAGGATLYRGKQRLEMRVATSGLMPNSSYTVWWVIFNNPAACVGGCGADDLPRPDVRASVLYAAGLVTGLGDTGNVTAHLEAGTPPQGVDVVSGNGLEPGRGYAAEVHLVVRTHGATMPGQVDQQIGSFNGGCAPVCTNVQAAGFAPVAP
jgi:hypothetical protein